MKGYVCVYRHAERSERHVRITAASGGPILQDFLTQYSDPSSYLDWGDDPAFFSAERFLGDAASATWGVCRANVRAHLNRDDFVVFFCAKPAPNESTRCDYFFIGVGTVQHVISREQLWRERRFARYRPFLNVLARPEGGRLQCHEYFYPGHPTDWEKRLANYVLFGGPLSCFNLNDPLHVATYSGALPEKWHVEKSSTVAALKRSLFGRAPSARRLRTSHSRHAHSHLNIGRSFPGTDLLSLRLELLRLVRNAA